MEIFDLSELRQLLATVDPPCVSLCMPTSVNGPDCEQDQVRLKNLATQVEKELEGWLRPSVARQWSAKIRRIPEDHDFWMKRASGLALFLDRQSLRRYRLPFRVGEFAVVSDQFQIKSLLPMLSNGESFFILVLSQRKVRFYEASEYQIREIEVPGMPQRIEAALNLVNVDRGSQTHLASKVGRGKQTSVFHGQGGVKDTHKEELSQFFRIIDKALQPLLSNQSSPLLLAGVGYLLSIFREISHYPQIVSAELKGNYDHSGPQQIQEQAWPLVQPLLKENQLKAIEKYQRLAGTGMATDDISQCLTAAFDGRVETLLLDTDRCQWGTCDLQGRKSVVREVRQAGDQDLIGLVAARTLLAGGQVFAVADAELPSSRGVAAVLRY